VRRVVRYGFAGLLATVIYFCATLAFVELVQLDAVTAAVAATGVVILTSYVVNRRWVFSTDRSHASSFSRFAVASLLSVGINAGLMHLAVDVFEWTYIAGLVLTTAIVPPVNFVINYFWSFRPV
jgi:putative flippase GtrA